MGGASSRTLFIDIIETLNSKEIDSSDHEFWDELWKTVLPGEVVL